SAAIHAYHGFNGFERARATHEAFVGDELNDRHGHGEQERIPYSRRPWFRCSWLVFGREPDDGFEATPEHALAVKRHLQRIHRLLERRVLHDRLADAVAVLLVSIHDPCQRDDLVVLELHGLGKRRDLAGLNIVAD